MLPTLGWSLRLPLALGDWPAYERSYFPNLDNPPQLAADDLLSHLTDVGVKSVDLEELSFPLDRWEIAKDSSNVGSRNTTGDSAQTMGDYMIARATLAAASLLTGIGLMTAPVAVADPPYKNCTEAHQDGRWDIPQSDSAYRSKLDRDDDGIACES